MAGKAQFRAVQTDKAPAAIGPYSQAIVSGSFVFCSGQLPIDPATGNLATGVAAQTRQSLQNMKSFLESAGSGMDAIVKTIVFLKDMESFGEMNATYAEYFDNTPPARSTIEVARLPRDAMVEIEATALLKS